MLCTITITHVIMDYTIHLLSSTAIIYATLEYKIDVYTGKVRNGGTDANVYITLFGESKQSGELLPLSLMLLCYL